MTSLVLKTVQTLLVLSLQESVLVVSQGFMEHSVNINVADVLSIITLAVITLYVIKIPVNAHLAAFVVSMVTSVRKRVPSVLIANVSHLENVKAVILASMEVDVNFYAPVLLLCVIKILANASKPAVRDIMVYTVKHVSSYVYHRSSVVMHTCFEIAYILTPKYYVYIATWF